MLLNPYFFVDYYKIPKVILEKQNKFETVSLIPPIFL